jgi:DNA processing protein
VSAGSADAPGYSSPGLHRIERGDPRFPRALSDLSRPPSHLRVRGALSILDLPAVAIVGSRRASEEGRAIASELAKAVARGGGVVVSGGALGVDAAAHRGAVEGDGPTAIVLPTPIDAPAPRANVALFEAALRAGGLWLSEVEAVRGRAQFRERNRLIAALSQVVVVVEATEDSGTAHTLRAALALGRRVAVVPWSWRDPRGALGRAALRAGALALPDAAALLSLAGLEAPAPAQPSLAGLGPDDAPLVEALLAAPSTAGELAVALELPVARVLARLTALELAGRVRAGAGGRFEPA